MVVVERGVSCAQSHATTDSKMTPTSTAVWHQAARMRVFTVLSMAQASPGRRALTQASASASEMSGSTSTRRYRTSSSSMWSQVASR